MDIFSTIGKQGEGLYREKGSKFIGYALRADTVTEVEAQLADIKKAHPKARHHCYAYRLDLNGDNFRENDDGEPSGTAGRPIMGQIQSYNLHHVLVVVVRYFGGKLLGASGLIRAYKTAAAEAIRQATIIEDRLRVKVSLSATYASLNALLPIIKQDGVTLLSETYNKSPTFEILIPRDDLSLFKTQWEAIPGVETKNIVA